MGRLKETTALSAGASVGPNANSFVPAIDFLDGDVATYASPSVGPQGHAYQLGPSPILSMNAPTMNLPTSP